jgi:hypothetical protein
MSPAVNLALAILGVCPVRRVTPWKFMANDAIRVLRVFAEVLGLMLLVACQDAPPYLQSHPSWEMFPRASSPPPNCPGQYRLTVENFNGDFFLGCWGTKTD